MLWLFAILFGLALGLAGGGSISNLGRLRFRWPLVLVGAVVIREAVTLTPLSRIEGSQYVYAFTLAVIVLWSLWHLKRLPGVWLVTIGAALNLIVVLVNEGRMPVDATLAARQLGGVLVERGHLGQYTIMSGDTHLNWLADWLSLGPLPEAYSPGDMLIAMGIALIVLVSLHQAPESRVVS